MSKRKLGWVLINSKSRDPLSSIDNLEKCFKNKVLRKNTKQSKQSGHCSPC